MKPHDVIGLVVRLSGLACIVFAVFDLAGLVAKFVGINLASPYTWQRYLNGAIIFGIVGLILSVGAGRLMRLFYPKSPDQPR